jgi:hypothetical protein
LAAEWFVTAFVKSSADSADWTTSAVKRKTARIIRYLLKSIAVISHFSQIKIALPARFITRNSLLRYLEETMPGLPGFSPFSPVRYN